MRSVSAPLSAALAGLLLAASGMAQTGSFADGELIVRSQTFATGQVDLYRVNAVTGHGVPLSTSLYTGYTGRDWLAYDSYRDGVLAYISKHPLWTSPKLMLFRANGQETDLGFQSEALTCLAPTGDGRVYLCKAGVLHVLSAANQLAPVIDTSTGQPFNLPLESLIYDPGTQALIGATQPSLTHPCGGAGWVTVHRLTLSPAGKEVVASACTAWHFGDYAVPTGLDRMPGGDILLTLADGYVADDNLLRIQPAGPSVSLYAQPAPSALQGGVWSQKLGSAVVLDASASLLRTYAAGSSGTGPALACDVLFPSGAGDALIDVNFDGPVCTGSATQWGQGAASAGGIVPLLGAASCPKIGKTLPLTVGRTLGGAQGLLVLGLNAGALPLYGGTLYVMPPFVLQAPFVADHGGSGSGAGLAEILIPVPAQPSLIGIPLEAQAAVFDPYAPMGVALSNALTLVLG
jgi:hypothetical protein